MTVFRDYVLGDMLLRYLTDEQNHAGMMLVPLCKKDDVLDKNWALEPLVQCHARGDQSPNNYMNGHSMAFSSATARMKLAGQEKTGDTIVTTLEDGCGRVARHRLTWHEGLQAVRVSTVFENRTGAPLTLDMLSSANLGQITPFAPAGEVGRLMIHRARTCWSAEGRLQSESAEALCLEPSWAGHGMRIEKFGQVGSMPVRQWFPFAAAEDTLAGVTWAMQLACPSSWQAELRRKDDGLVMMMGLPDEDFGHWCKTLQNGESFETPECYVTCGMGGADRVSQRLLTIHMDHFPRRAEPLPVVFNEYCTTWGKPSHETMAEIARCIQGHGIDLMVMDAGWYAKDNGGWSDCGGDWIPNETRLFPQGLKATADAVRQAGMKPGIWFEAETCAPGSDIFRREDMLLTRHGTVIDTNNRRFLDLRKEEVQEYLAQRITALLKNCGFEYIKVDYNDCLGAGCDDPDSLGEGLRQNMQGTLRFFKAMKDAIPGLYIENCASGGHRLEPSLMAATDMASFSDAHECQEIPIIAAQLHRLILPAQSQIWAVLRRSDSIRRINFSLINTFLGVMCLSGDVLTLSPEQWQKVDEGIAFFRAVRDIIRDGVSAFHGQLSVSWRKPEGWQGIVRTAGRETLVTVHTFGGQLPEKVTLPVPGGRILRTMTSENNAVSLEGGLLTIDVKAPFEAIAVHLEHTEEE